MPRGWDLYQIDNCNQLNDKGREEGKCPGRWRYTMQGVRWSHMGKVELKVPLRLKTTCPVDQQVGVWKWVCAGNRDYKSWLVWGSRSLIHRRVRRTRVEGWARWEPYSKQQVGGWAEERGTMLISGLFLCSSVCIFRFVQAIDSSADKTNK